MRAGNGKPAAPRLQPPRLSGGPASELCAYAEGEPDLHTAAAHLLFGIVSNHPFVDGNKRVGLKAAAVFYILNGWELDGEDTNVYALVLDVAEGKIDVPEIAIRLRPMVREIELPDE